METMVFFIKKRNVSPYFYSPQKKIATRAIGCLLNTCRFCSPFIPNWTEQHRRSQSSLIFCFAQKKSHSFHAVSHSPPQPHHLLRPHHCRVAFPPFPLSPPFPIVVLQSCRSRHAAAALDWVCRCRCRCWVSVLADHTSSQLTACPLLALGGICRWG